MSETESKGPVIAAMGANFLIAIGKLVAGLLTGSAALLAEAGHSVADTVNQVFLLVGINLSDTTADEKHPHGYGKEAFFWSFLAAIFIFVAGAVFSIYEGTRTLVEDVNHHRTANELALAFGVLGTAAIFEGVSMTIAVRGLRAAARRKRWSVTKFLRDAPDPTIKTVFFEDGAALIGLGLATAGLATSELTGNEVWDGIASLSIGVVLALVAWILGMQSRKLLIGAAANIETRQALHDIFGAFPEVERVIRLLTMQLGAHSLLVTGEIQVRRDLTVEAIEGLLERIDAAIERAVPEVSDTFWELKRAPAKAP